MTVLQAIILGIVQGLTEFLPVSSSGHLVLVEHLLKVPHSDDITFEVFVHFGTLVSVVVVLWDDIVQMTRSTFHATKGLHFVTQYKENEYFRLGIFIILGSIPAAIVGIKFEDDVSAAFTDPKLVAVMLIITGLILFLTKLVSRPTEWKKIGVLSALVIGVAQAFAVIPGISRSGSTISAGMYLKVSPLQAARFSFLLSVPVIAGATLLKTVEIFGNGFSFEYILPILIGTVVSFGSGYFAIKFLLRIVEKGQFSVFAFYCLFVGTIGIIFL